MANNRNNIPTPVLDIIDSVINQDFLAENQDKIIEEYNDRNGKNAVIECDINDIDKNIAHSIYRFDTCGDMDIFPFFKNREGYKRMCDNVVLCETPSCLYIFAIELKDSVASPKEQLELSEQFLNFIIARMKFLEENFDKTVEIRKIGIKWRARFKTSEFADMHFDSNHYLQLPKWPKLNLNMFVNMEVR
jgi:hypothetical protein